MNHLSSETSPYLRQHATNPVDWYPWCEEAFELARAQDRPVFLSVGYSACHWCHVMAHESFEDPATAEVLNRMFVCVKVDREERPDVDAVYMQAVQAMTGRGGWPMSVWLTPDGLPFYGGTYFPDTDRHGTPSLARVCEAIDRVWNDGRGEVLEQARRLTDALAAPLPFDAGGPPADEILAAALAKLSEELDPDWGGFGQAPKFPPSATISFLCRSFARSRSPVTLSMICTTLDAMAAGGIHDHVGGGFARYSTDAQWLVPHFEKMLYDNALLTTAYLHGWEVTGEPRYRRVVEDTVTYVLRDLASPGGGFCAAQDADSEGEEGRFYLWDIPEIDEVCGPDAPEVIRYFGVTASGNYEGRNILHVVDRTEDVPDAVARSLPRLLARRAQRVHPGLDDKVVLSWNALFVRALAEAAAAFGRDDWMTVARDTARFLLTDLRRDDGRLLRCLQAGADLLPRIGRARHLAYAEDYAALLEALVTLAEVDGDVWLDDACSIARDLLSLFHDPEHGGFFMSGSDAAPLVVRPKDLQDGATPAAGSMAANGLLRLAALTGDESYGAPAVEVLRMLAGAAAAHPGAFGYLLEAYEREPEAATGEGAGASAGGRVDAGG